MQLDEFLEHSNYEIVSEGATLNVDAEGAAILAEFVSLLEADRP